MADSAVIEGTVAPGFEGVRAAFERCFAELGETAAGFCALAVRELLSHQAGLHALLGDAELAARRGRR